MKLKITEDFKKGARIMLVYMVTAIFAYPVYHLIKGDFLWEDTLLNAGLLLAVIIVLGLFFFFGSQIPEKKDD